jgi:membrane-associated protease RseP (regulator of RpoE activity)
MEEPQPTTEPTAEEPRPRWWLHALLLLATLGTTTAFGVVLASGLVAPLDPDKEVGVDHLWHVATSPKGIGLALSYSLSVLAILFCHEMGHYLLARRYGVSASPPYFLPGLPPFGTFGAFIRMRIRTIDATRLFRIGAGGPYAGFVVCIPVLLIGLFLSDVQPVPPGLEEAQLGDSLLMWALTRVLFGTLPEGHDVFLHPMAYAGWVGLFVTSFNLVPLGQLDGGHIAYTLFGERFNKIAWFLLAGLIVLGVTVFPGWLVLVFFLLILGPKHPVVLEGEPLGRGDRMAAWGAMVLFALTFVPQPFKLPTILDLVLGR